MANDKKPEGKAPKAPQAQTGAKEGPAASTKCKAEGCKKDHTKFGFCLEHYDMYMAGVLRGDGRKPIDFEKKFQEYTQKSHRKVA